MTVKDADFIYMAQAIKLAGKGKYTTHPNPRVGCVLVNNGKVIGEGYHQRAGGPHAEIHALNAATQAVQGATAYVTLEPCSHTGKTPPCANALIDAGVSRVVVAMQDPNPQVAGQGIQRLREAGIEVQTGILEDQSRKLNPGFIKRMEQGLPWVRVKLAMSLDGRTAMASGESKWITAADARTDVQFLRASADAILTGIGTVLADNPSMNVRLSATELAITGGVRQPKCVILDSRLQTPFDAKILTTASNTIICTANDQDDRINKAFNALGVQLLSFEPEENGRLPLNRILKELARQDINEVHVEAGATLCGALIKENLVDELVIYVAPSLMGSNARGLLHLPGLEKMAEKINLDIQDIRAVGDDWRITAGF
jgi:diaminohydroxyphosphoribosylaminopyrimidine deaminase/5-amino-6-(5-phosphoribosylamino)uracil reductase